MTALLVEATAQIETPAPRVSLTKLTPAQRAGLRQQAALRSAWPAYYEHAQSCAECHRRLHNCAQGAALWEAYREARGPIFTPIPGGRP